MSQFNELIIKLCEQQEIDCFYDKKPESNSLEYSSIIKIKANFYVDR